MADIFGVRVTPDLDTLNSIIICNWPGGQTDPSVVFNGKHYIVAWSDPIFHGILPWITVARVTSEGQVFVLGYAIGNAVNNREYLPDIACDYERSLVVWSQEFYGVCGRFIDSVGQPEDTVLTIGRISATSNAPEIEFGNDKYLVVWADFCSTGTDLDIYGQLVSSAGHLIGDRITIADGSESQKYPELSFDGIYFFVVWLEGSHDICGQFVSTNGKLFGHKFYISDTTSYTRDGPAVSAGLNEYLTVWGEYHDAFDVYGNLDIPVGIKEEEKIFVKESIPSVIFGSLSLPKDSYYKIFDISGRLVEPDQLKAGIYFIKVDEQTIIKVVKIR